MASRRACLRGGERFHPVDDAGEVGLRQPPADRHAAEPVCVVVQLWEGAWRGRESKGGERRAAQASDTRARTRQRGSESNGWATIDPRAAHVLDKSPSLVRKTTKAQRHHLPHRLTRASLVQPE